MRIHQSATPIESRISHALRFGPLTVRQIADRIGVAPAYIQGELPGFPELFERVDEPRRGRDRPLGTGDYVMPADPSSELSAAEQVAEIQSFIAARLKKMRIPKAELSRRTDRSYELIIGILRGEQKNGGSVLVLLEMLNVIGCKLTREEIGDG